MTVRASWRRFYKEPTTGEHEHVIVRIVPPPHENQVAPKIRIFIFEIVPLVFEVL
jgi:hypothetical protein